MKNQTVIRKELSAGRTEFRPNLAQFEKEAELVNQRFEMSLRQRSYYGTTLKVS